MILGKINSPKDLKNLTIKDLEQLCTEVRIALLNKLSTVGGHIGPNLGMVEMTVAMHKVFNSPIDKIVYDVSHQSYAHKMLTGRKHAFLNSNEYFSVSGYTNPDESEHDFFKVGHTSTSVSLACGLAKGRDLVGTKENIIAVIGDGSLSGGEAYEGLNNAAETGTNMIIVVNDNEMSIAENYGGLYNNLKLLRETKGKAECNFFKAMGLDYIYVEDGHSLESLISAFEKVKDTDKPIVVHVKTIKGKGYELAEKNKENWHYGMPFELETGERNFQFGDNYSELTGAYLLNKMKEDEKVAVITAGTPSVVAFNEDRRKEAGKQFIDVGIAEEHAVALASGMAKNGAKPIFAVYSTFIQRCYDQLSQDLCINNNPAVILVFGGGLTGFSDVTHLGYFDTQVVGNIPNMVYLAPTSKEEYFAMLDWAIDQNEHPVSIKVPSLGVIQTEMPLKNNFYDINRYIVTESGKDIAILALGDFYQLGEDVKADLKEKHGIDATLINPRFITGVDEQLLETLKENHKLVITLENSVLNGGFGEKITRYYGASDMKVINFGGKNEFTDRLTSEEIYENNHLNREQILEDIVQVFSK
ncbi:1-deoxy-D-xylulose-5-phosphate synthase [Cetobacterium sp. ZWU0022]|uniref:1-deoxy-D-xylulose-5-phosphate synthase n=1 Tax=Cetobacterium sp. ZWU0022 TaxID=1340502 RepID=UPI0006484574|nr:1-deoxy-D-xylulose-5-phosphate synthase [Cetobacterium sp. ZWU0022]